MSKNNTPTYEQAQFIHTMLSQVNLTEYRKEIRKPLFDMKRVLDPVIDQLQQEKQIVLLLNGGVEKENARTGVKYFDRPDFPKRENKSDKEYAEVLRKHQETVQKLDNELRLLLKKPCGVTISRVFTPEDFEDLCKKVGNLELADCETLLVIQQ